MLVNLNAQSVEGHALVLAAGDENDLLRKGIQPRDSPGRTGGDGIIVIADAGELPDKLNAVLNALERLRDLALDLRRDQGPGCATAAL